MRRAVHPSVGVNCIAWAYRPIVPDDVRGQGNFCLIGTAADITWESSCPMGIALDVRWHVIPLTYSNNVC